MRKGIVARLTAIMIAVISLISFAALFDYAENLDATTTNDITFNLNGGSIDGQISFVVTASELNVTGLPDASGFTIPS